MIARARATSSAVCTKLRATKSTPRVRPKRRSSTSLSVSADAGSATPGALMPLCPPSIAAMNDHEIEPRRGTRHNSELDAAIVEQESVTRLRGTDELGVGRKDPARSDWARPFGEDQRRRLPSTEAADRRRAGRCESSVRSGPA